MNLNLRNREIELQDFIETCSHTNIKNNAIRTQKYEIAAKSRDKEKEILSKYNFHRIEDLFNYIFPHIPNQSTLTQIEMYNIAKSELDSYEIYDKISELLK